MKKIKNLSFIFLPAILMLSFMTGPETGKQEYTGEKKNTEIQWKSFEEAVDLKNSDKKYFI